METVGTVLRPWLIAKAASSPLVAGVGRSMNQNYGQGQLQMRSLDLKSLESQRHGVRECQEDLSVIFFCSPVSLEGKSK